MEGFVQIKRCTVKVIKFKWILYPRLFTCTCEYDALEQYKQLYRRGEECISEDRLSVYVCKYIFQVLNLRMNGPLKDYSQKCEVEDIVIPLLMLPFCVNSNLFMH